MYTRVLYIMYTLPYKRLGYSTYTCTYIPHEDFGPHVSNKCSKLNAQFHAFVIITNQNDTPANMIQYDESSAEFEEFPIQYMHLALFHDSTTTREPISQLLNAVPIASSAC